MKLNKLLLSGIASVLVSHSVAAYESGDWLLRAGVATVAPNDDSGTVKLDGSAITGGGGNVEASDETALGISVAYMLTPALGVELLAASPFEHELKADGELAGLVNDIGTASQLPPTLSLLWHLAPNSGSPWQFYLGLGVNYTIFFNEDLSGEVGSALEASDLELDDSIGPAAQAGVDWSFDDNWLVNISVMYADIETEASFNANDGASKVKVNVDIDPWIYRLNLGYKF